ncbi:hypothetical protein IC607_08555 [Cellulomonas sp. JH27-2]|uniref:hypothetical protein n=1 Tax=Cellulomonas sp. JH27-2 TaxID=2774139 RepID=UPI00177DE4DA|nr:hypothetical protein [Cellulomonas sp. JH27-2]MBD8059017.1 hypothetical protein [Cellulomonas sp. JH27-2]
MVSPAGFAAQVAEVAAKNSIRVVRSMSVSAPDGAAHMIVALDNDAVATTTELIVGLAPRLMILEPHDPEGFQAHVVSDHWLRVVYLTPAALDAAIADAEAPLDDETSGERDEATTAKLRFIAEAVAAEIPLSDHGGATELARRFRERVERELPADGARILESNRYVVWEHAADILATLKDRHGGALHTDAATYAAEIFAAEGPFAGKVTRPVLRDVAYRHMKRLDPTCTTKASIESIVLELAGLIDARR